MATAESNTDDDTVPDPLLESMRANGVPITRENYIALNYLGEPPEHWTAEDEDGLPLELQDWNQFEFKKGKLVVKKEPLSGEKSVRRAGFDPDQPRDEDGVTSSATAS
jgi:hypothetical protein